MRSRLPLLTALLAVVLVLPLVGCEDEPEPKFVPTTETATSSTATTSVPTTTPVTSAPPEKESAKAFIRRWQALAVEMTHTGNSKPYLALTENCRECDKFAGSAEELYAQGGSLVGGELRVSNIERVGRVEEVFVYEFVTSSSPSTVKHPGQSPERLPGGRSAYQLNLVRDGTTWVVTRISRIPI